MVVSEKGTRERDFVNQERQRLENSPNQVFRFRLMADELNKVRGRVLDIGCNTGAFPKYYNTGAESCYCTDIDLFMTRCARENTKGLLRMNFVNCSAKGLPFKDESIDTILLLDVIEHLPLSEHQQVVEEIRRVATQGAMLILSTANRMALTALEEWLRAKWNGDEFEFNAWGPNTHKYIYSSGQLIGWLKGNGCRIDKKIGYFYLPDYLYSAPHPFVVKMLMIWSYLISKTLGRLPPLSHFGGHGVIIVAEIRKDEAI